MRLRPVGDNVFVMFKQGDWALKGDSFVGQTGLYGSPYRLDGLVVATGPRVTGIGAGDTVYGDPRRGRILVVDGTMYHIMEQKNLMMKAEVDNGE